MLQYVACVCVRVGGEGGGGGRQIDRRRGRGGDQWRVVGGVAVVLVVMKLTEWLWS
jgi:hypothetical protein